MQDSVIHIRLTADEKEKIKIRADKADMSMSKFIRLSALNSEIKDYRELAKLNYQINKIGNNINQATRIMNTYFDFSDVDFNYIYKEFLQVKKMISEFDK